MSTIDDLLNTKKISDINKNDPDPASVPVQNTDPDDQAKEPRRIKVVDFEDQISDDFNQSEPVDVEKTDTPVLDDFEIKEPLIVEEKETVPGGEVSEVQTPSPEESVTVGPPEPVVPAEPTTPVVEEFSDPEPAIDDFDISKPQADQDLSEKTPEPDTPESPNEKNDLSSLLNFYDSKEGEQETEQTDPKPEVTESKTLPSDQAAEDKVQSASPEENGAEDEIVGDFPDKIHEWQQNDHRNSEESESQGTEPVKDDKEQSDHTSLDFGVSEDILDDKMKEIDLKEKEQQIEAQALSAGFGYINFKGVPIAADNLQKIPFELSEKRKIICFYFAAHSHARIAFTQENIKNLEELKKELPKSFEKIELEWFLVSEESFDIAYKQYDNLPKIKETTKGVHIEEEEFLSLYESISALDDVDSQVKNTNTTQMITLFVAAGVKLGASDIHIEAEVDGVKLRYRVDGILHTASVLDRELWEKVIARIKLLANLKMNVSFEPQDGRFSIFLPEEKIDVRLSCLPTNYGESVVMRLLRSKSIDIDFKTIGLSEKYYKMLSKEISRPNGMIITTGPTGSGKTTTLYSILKELNQPEVKIITVEDPVEYELKGVNQSQMDHKKGYTFAKGLRSILRQDPDIVMVGEMRDLETVDIALNAALTGHLVLSTIHTNNAAGAVPRFLAMGAKPYLLAPALNLIMAQRLARKLCPKCKKEHILSDTEQEKVAQILESLPETEKQQVDFDNLSFFKAEGCPECGELGYKGRIGLFEMFNMTPDIEKIILSDEVSEYRIAEEARKNGMVSMIQDGVLKALEGTTSLEEVYRVIE